MINDLYIFPRLQCQVPLADINQALYPTHTGHPVNCRAKYRICFSNKRFKWWIMIVPLGPQSTRGMGLQAFLLSLLCNCFRGLLWPQWVLCPKCYELSHALDWLLTASAQTQAAVLLVGTRGQGDSSDSHHVQPRLCLYNSHNNTTLAPALELFSALYRCTCPLQTDCKTKLIQAHLKRNVACKRKLSRSQKKPQQCQLQHIMASRASSQLHRILSYILTWRCHIKMLLLLLLLLKKKKMMMMQKFISDQTVDVNQLLSLSLKTLYTSIAWENSVALTL